MMKDSQAEVTGDADVPAHDLDEGRIALGGPYGDHVADEPEEKTCQPKAQAEAKRRGQGAVENGHRSRRTPHQDRLSQGPVNGRDEA